MIELGKHLEDAITYAEGFKHLQKGVKGHVQMICSIETVFFEHNFPYFFRRCKKNWSARFTIQN